MKSNVVLAIGIVLVLLVGIFTISYYFVNQSNECMNNPLVYGAGWIEEQFGHPFVGYGTFQVPMGIKPPIVAFNSSSLTIDN